LITWYSICSLSDKITGTWSEDTDDQNSQLPSMLLLLLHAQKELSLKTLTTVSFWSKLAKEKDGEK